MMLDIAALDALDLRVIVDNETDGLSSEVMGSSLLLTHLWRSCRITVDRPSDLTSLLQLILPEDIGKSLETDENRDIHSNSENQDMLISILNSYMARGYIRNHRSLLQCKAGRTMFSLSNRVKGGATQWQSLLCKWPKRQWHRLKESVLRKFSNG